MYSKWKKYLFCRLKLVLYGGIFYMFLVMLTVVILTYQQRGMWLVPVIFLLMNLFFGGIIYYFLVIPYRKCQDAMRRFAAGQLTQDIFRQELFLSQELEEMIEQFRSMIDFNEMIIAGKKQAEYIALQNQINPHFLYNTLEGIRGETLHAGLDHVAEMTEALATFFRYTISNMDNLVTVEDELKNIEDYYIIQQYRFGDRLHLEINYQEEEAQRILRCRLPKLTLQPIVENAVCHGIEDMVETGQIRIFLEISDKRLIITVSDNGVGMSEEKRDKLNRKLNRTHLECIDTVSENGGGIAVVNVNNRIRLLFGEEYGIYIYSMSLMGTDVEITLPLIEEGAEIMFEMGR